MDTPVTVVEPKVTLETAKTLVVSAPFVDDDNTVKTQTRKGCKTEAVVKMADIPFKVTEDPANCSKCGNRRHLGFVKSKKYVGIKPCKCLLKVLYTPTEEEVAAEQRKAQIPSNVNYTTDLYKPAVDELSKVKLPETSINI